MIHYCTDIGPKLNKNNPNNYSRRLLAQERMENILVFQRILSARLAIEPVMNDWQEDEDLCNRIGTKSSAFYVYDLWQELDLE